MRIRVGDREVDLRISVLPVQFGESIVMRLLDTGGKVPGLGGLGASEKDHRRMADLAERPRGLVLVTGPTGSGKTCTLYSMIDHVRDDSVNVVSIEDPVEHEFRGVKQVAVNTKTGLTFARGLKSILRQDPDVIMVGEMRDVETASIAMQASLTGHMVLSTLHTNTAAGAITRLRNMGLPPYLLASSVSGVIAQRLVRKLCSHCRTSHIPSDDDLRGLGMTGARGTAFYAGAGCERCAETGYRGRTAVFEIFAVDSRAKELITDGAPEEVLVKSARKGGMRSLLEDGIDKAGKGVTSLEELRRVLRADVEPEGRLCRRCGGGLRSAFRCCPWCGAAAEDRCACCGGTREEGWKFCPWCEPASEAPRVVDLPAND